MTRISHPKHELQCKRPVDEDWTPTAAPVRGERTPLDLKGPEHETDGLFRVWLRPTTSLRAA